MDSTNLQDVFAGPMIRDSFVVGHFSKIVRCIVCFLWKQGSIGSFELMGAMDNCRCYKFGYSSPS